MVPIIDAYIAEREAEWVAKLPAFPPRPEAPASEDAQETIKLIYQHIHYNRDETAALAVLNAHDRALLPRAPAEAPASEVTDDELMCVICDIWNNAEAKGDKSTKAFANSMNLIRSLLSRAPRAPAEAPASEDAATWANKHLANLEKLINIDGIKKRDGWSLGCIAKVREYLALLARAPSAESGYAQRLGWKDRAEAAEAELAEARGTLEGERRGWTQVSAALQEMRDHDALIIKGLREDLADRPSKAYYEGVLADKDSEVTLLRKENEALREAINYAIERLERLKVQPTLAGHLRSALLRSKGGGS